MTRLAGQRAIYDQAAAAAVVPLGERPEDELAPTQALEAVQIAYAEVGTKRFRVLSVEARPLGPRRSIEIDVSFTDGSCVRLRLTKPRWLAIVKEVNQQLVGAAR